MEELPDTIQVNIKNKFTSLSKDLIVYVSDDVNLYQHIYDNPSVHGAYVRTWPADVVSAVKGGASTIICSIENTPIVLSLAQMKSTTTKELYHHVAKAGILYNINFVLEVVRADSLADEMTINSDAMTEDELGSTNEYPILGEIPSESVLSNATETMNIKIQNQFTLRSTVLDIKISQDATIFDEIYDNPALLEAQIRNWSSDIVADIKNKSKAIVASVSGTPMRISIAQMRKKSTKQLQDFVSQAALKQHPQLILGIVKSDQILEIDAKLELQETTKSLEDFKVGALPTKEGALDEIIEIGATDLDRSIYFDNEELIDANFVQGTKGKDDDEMQDSTDLETVSSVHEDDETIVAGNGTPKTTPQSQHDTPLSHQIPSSNTPSKDEIDGARNEDTSFIAALDFDTSKDLGQKTNYDDLFPEDQTGFEITFDQGVDDVFQVSITEERLDRTEGNPSREKAKQIDEQANVEEEKETKNEKDYDESDTVLAKDEESSAGDVSTADATENQMETEASFAPRSQLDTDTVDIESLSPAVEVVVHYQTEESDEGIKLGVEISPEDAAPVESKPIAADEEAALIAGEEEKEAARIASTKIQSRARGIAVRSSQSFRHTQASVIQKAFRGSIARVSHGRNVLASTKIQSRARGIAVRSSQSFRHTQASVIQKAFRGSIARVSHSRNVLASTKIQSRARGIAVRSSQSFRHAQASVIQKAFRGSIARVSYSRNVLASTKIQSWARGIAVRSSQSFRHAQASVIQKAFRGSIARENSRNELASTKIQSRARGIAVRSSQSFHHAQASVIQKAFRGSTARVCYSRDVCAIIKIQNLGRRWIAKQRLAKCERAALKIQYIARQRASKKLTSHRQQEVEIEESRKNGACKLQSVYRGHKARRDVDSQHLAAAKIQFVCRAWLAAKREERMPSLGRRWIAKKMLANRDRAVSKIRSIARQRGSKKKTSDRQPKVKIEEPRNNGVCKLQSIYRGNKVRRNINSERMAAVQIQNVYRARVMAKREEMISAEKEAKLKAEEGARIRSEEATRVADEAQTKAEEEAEIRVEEEPRLTAEAQAKAENEASLEETLFRLKAKEDARLKEEEEARLKVEEETRVVAEAQAKAEIAIATLELEEEARLKADEEAEVEEEARLKAKVEEEARLTSLDQTTTTFDDSEGIEVEYPSADHEAHQCAEEMQEAIYSSVAKEIKSASMREENEIILNSDAAHEESDLVDVNNENDEAAVHLISAAMESSETQTQTETTEVEDSAKQQEDDAVSHEALVDETETTTSQVVEKVSEDDSDSKMSRTIDVSTGSSESRKQEGDSVFETQTAVHTMHSCETFGINNRKPSSNELATSETSSAASTKCEAIVPSDTRNTTEDGTGSSIVPMVTMAGVYVNHVRPEVSKPHNDNLAPEDSGTENKSEHKVGLSTSSQHSQTENNSISLDTIDRVVMGVQDKRRQAAGDTAVSHNQGKREENEREESEQKVTVSSSEELYGDTNSTSMDTIDRIVIGLDNNSKRDVASSNAASSQSREKRDESTMSTCKPNNSTTQVAAFNRDQVPGTPEGTQERNPESPKSHKASSTAPLPAIVTTRNRDGRQASQAASVCSSLNTSPSYYDKFDSKIGSKMILKALHTPVSEEKSSKDLLTLSDDDQSSKPETASVTSKVSLKDDIVILTARYEVFAKQLQSLVVHSNEFHKAICEKEKTQAKFFDECTSMTNGTPLHLDIGKNEIPESATMSYAKAQVDDMITPRSMSSVHALARIFSSDSSTEYQQHILAYVGAWTEAVTSKVEAELQTYDKLEETLYHYEVKVDELRKKSKGKTSTQLTRNYKKLATAGQKRDEQLEKACYLLKAVVDNSWKDLYPLIEQTMVWELNRRDGQVDTMGTMLPKSMANMKENIKSGKTLPAPDQESLEAELNTQTRENRKLQYRINKLEAILRSDDWSSKNEMISKLSSFKMSPTGRKTAE
ncbi:unnamed protein product [Cylindrotheca closterium]|uniref:Uncharacterized protein n=1 Tax=Cylindrotheca closterium TaxID=2856 RepID=A0AAD2JIB8_9STRA|nr:unnamed protein product [Cylindrotheca closterium]